MIAKIQFDKDFHALSYRILNLLIILTIILKTKYEKKMKKNKNSIRSGRGQFADEDTFTVHQFTFREHVQLKSCEYSVVENSMNYVSK